MPLPTPPTPPDSITDFSRLPFSFRPGLTGLAPRPESPRRVPLGYPDGTAPLAGANDITHLLTNPLEERRDECDGPHYHRNTDSRAFWLSMRHRSLRHRNRMLNDADNAIFGNIETPEDEATDGSNASDEIITDGSSDALDVLPKRDPIEEKVHETNSEQAQRTQLSHPSVLSDAWLAFLNRNKDKDESHANETEQGESESSKRGVGLLSFEKRTRIEKWRQGCVHGATRGNTESKTE